jgi:hypothetical protein
MRKIALGVLACGALVSACTSSPSEGAPVPASGSRLSPEIPTELDVGRFTSAPCTLLTQKQPIAGDVVAGVHARHGRGGWLGDHRDLDGG